MAATTTSASPGPAKQPAGLPEAAHAPAFKRLLHALYRYVPAFDSLRVYTWRSLRLDVFAGLTVAAVAIPQAMAYATIAGLDPHFGLYTAIVMTAVGALLDSSKQLINGPTNAISIAMLSALAWFETEQKLEMAILLAFMIGIVQTGITLFRLGDLTRYISNAVIVGFTVGAGVLLVLDQLKNLFGLPARGGAHDHFLVRFWLTMRDIGQTNWITLAVGGGTIILVLALRQVGTRWGVRLPDFLLAIAVMALLVGWLGLDGDAYGVKVVGAIPAQLPGLEAPTITWDGIRGLAGSALAIGVLGLLEAIAMAKAIAARTGQRLDMNQQCLSEGVANLTGSFFQCFPGSGSLTRSAINVQAGAVSQWSGVVSAAAVAATVLLFARFAYYIPRASLAGILFLSAWRLVDRKQLLFHLRTTSYDAGIVIATAVAAVAVSVEFCILIGVFLSFVLFVPRAARIHMSELTLTPERIIRERVDSDPRCQKIAIVSLEGELFFGAAPDLENHLDTIARRVPQGLCVVVLRLKRVRNPDAVCLEILERFFDRMQASNVHVLLCGVRRDLAHVLHTSGLESKIGLANVFHEKPTLYSATLEAVRYAYELVKDNICAECPRRGELNKEVLYYMI